ncbi:immunoglobulin-like domain-containing protein [Enterococcus entomosocium]|uniref:immunoglobulin-like domain-containing protein n=1 Tax=Enterococcus entomosocium TaxID=3034352 RepID=UPI003BEDBC92
MNNKFGRKATGLLLICHLTLAALPITVLGAENTEESTPIQNQTSKELVESSAILPDAHFSEDTGSQVNPSEETESSEITEFTSEGGEAEKGSITTRSKVASEAENIEEYDTNNSDNANENKLTTENQVVNTATQVNTELELSVALKDPSVTQISLSRNITMTSSVTWTGALKMIEGNEYTLTFANSVRLYGDTVNQELNISNLRIVANAPNTIYQNSSSNVTFTNVTHENQHATGRLLYLNGSNSTVNFYGKNLLESGALIWANTDSKINVTNGASLKVNNNGTFQAIYLANNGQLNLEENSFLDITQNNFSNSVKTVLLEGDASSVNINSGATLKITSAPETGKTQEALSTKGSLNVATGGILDAVSNSSFSTINVGKESNFDEGSNIRIQNNNINGTVLGSNSGTTKITLHSSKGIQTWERGDDFSGKPLFSYSTINQGSFSLNGFSTNQVTSLIESDDNQFNLTFNCAQIGKFLLGDFVDKEVIQQTTIDPLTTKSTEITGQAEPNSNLVIEIEGQAALTGSVSGDGTYKVSLPDGSLVAGSKVNVTASLNGLSSVAETVVEESPKPTIAETTISDLNTDSTSVTGTAEPNADITIKAGDTIIANGRVGSDGVYSLSITKQKAETVVTAQATLNGINSNVAEITVVRSSISKTTINEVTTTSKKVTGTAEPYADIQITVGNSGTKNGKVDSEGNFEVEIDPQQPGTTITAQASIDGLSSNIGSTIVIIDPASTKGTITPDAYNVSSGSQFLTGTYTGDVVSARVYVNGLSVRGGNFTQGNFEFYIGNRIQLVDDIVEIEALDQNGKALDRKVVDLKRDLSGSISLNQYRVGEATINGTFIGDVNLARLVINGTPSSAWGGTFNSDGTFSFYVANLDIKVGDKVEIQALNRQVSGSSEVIKILETKEIKIVDQFKGTITPDKYHYTDTMITGTFSGDINFANLIIDGQSVGNWGGSFNKDTGSFEFYVQTQFREQIKNASKVELQTYYREMKDGKTIDHKIILQPIEIVKAEGTISPLSFKITDREITGSFTGDINFANLIMDGKSYSWGGTFDSATKTFTYFVNRTAADLMRDAEKVELVGYHRDILNWRPIDIELDRSVVKINKEFIGTITSDDYKLGSRIITGSYTGEDINFGRLDIDGTTLWVSAFKEGEFTAYLNAEQANQITKDSKITIYGLHRYVNQSTENVAESNVVVAE